MRGAPSKTSWFCLVVLLLLFAAQVGLTLPVFSDTVDERLHIEAGLEYFQRGVYEYEPQHPPLARMAVGVLPYYLGGLRLTEDRMEALGANLQKPLDAPRGPGETFLWAGMWKNATLGEYWRTLTLARLGSLFFGLIGVGVVFLWAHELYGDRAAIASGALAAFSPTLLAHAGLATLDAGAAATGTAAAYAFWRWTQAPTLRGAGLAGAVTAVAICTKFSNLAYLPPAFVAYLVLAWRLGRFDGVAPRVFFKQAAVASVAGLFLVLAVYRFEFGGIAPEGSVYVSELRRSEDGFSARAARLLGSTPVPVPALFRGVIDVAAHNDFGHAAYLLGEWSDRGRVLYFPIALGVKTTIPLLALGLWAIIDAFRNRSRLALLAAPILPLVSALGIAMASDINIGVRHILIAYPLLAVAAGSLFEQFSLGGGARTPRNLVLALLMAGHIGSSANAHPDYLAYFNTFAGDAPQSILLDSNLDWGQDVARLGEWTKANGDPCVIVRLFTAARPDKFGICTKILPSGHPDAGLLAISANFLLGIEGSSPALRALAAKPPLAVVGKSIYIYRIEPEDLGTLAPPWFFQNYEQVGERAR